MLELQITQEYVGQSTYLVFLAPMWKEVLIGHIRQRPWFDGGRNRGRFGGETCGLWNCGSCQHGIGSQLVQPSFRPGKLVRFRPFSVESLFNI